MKNFIITETGDRINVDQIVKEYPCLKDASLSMIKLVDGSVYRVKKELMDKLMNQT